MKTEALRLLFAGPLMGLLGIAGLCLVSSVAVAIGKTEALSALGDRAVQRLEQGLVLPLLWGIAAALLALTTAGVLMQVKALALLALLVVFAGLVLAAVGLGVAASALGRNLHGALGAPETDTLPTLRTGLWTLLLASLLPFAGWTLVLLALAAGIGATLETLLARRAAPPTN